MPTPASIMRVAHELTRQDCKFFPDLTYRKHFANVLRSLSRNYRGGLEPKRPAHQPRSCPAKEPAMKVYLTTKRFVPVANFAEASKRVRKFIDDGDLGAGCGSSLAPFTGGNIVDDAGNVIAHVSYNGRVWPPTGWAPGVKPLHDPR